MFVCFSSQKLTLRKALGLRDSGGDNAFMLEAGSCLSAASVNPSSKWHLGVLIAIC